jgi:hypothetical protein
LLGNPEQFQHHAALGEGREKQVADSPARTPRQSSRDLNGRTFYFAHPLDMLSESVRYVGLPEIAVELSVRT